MAHHRLRSIQIKVNTTSPIHVTEEEFLSLGMDSNLIRNNWQTWDFGSRRLRTLAKGLSPAVLRLCGTDGDRMFFTKDSFSVERRVLRAENYVPPIGPPFPTTNFTMSSRDWDDINQFCADVGWRIMFGFNVQPRKGENWDMENAKELLRYSILKGYAPNLDFELGNEPDIFFIHPNMLVLTAKQLANDYKQLRTVLDTEFKGHFSSAKLYGPGIAIVTHDSQAIVPYLSEFLDHVDISIIKAITWHQYYGGKELNNLENYTDSDILDTYVYQCQSVLKTVKNSPHPDVPIWQGETASTFESPGGNFCDSYVAGFMLLDKLGVSAKLGMKLVIRQTFYGFWFALVNARLNATPIYWVALLYRQLVGMNVLDVTMSTDRSIRIYANSISRKASTIYRRNAIVIYAMNLGDADVALDLSLVGSQISEYLFSPSEPDNLVSMETNLNDRLITITDDRILPDLLTFGRHLESSTKIVLPAKRFAFYVIDDASGKASL